MSAEASMQCGAGYGERTPERENSRNGYRHRPWDTRVGTIDLAVPKLRSGVYSPEFLLQPRRRAEQGTVLLHVQVAADGSVARVEIAESSGFDALDESAIETVRTRWRFVPARREGNAIESWCEVPIRFALTEANAQ